MSRATVVGDTATYLMRIEALRSDGSWRRVTDASEVYVEVERPDGTLLPDFKLSDGNVTNMGRGEYRVQFVVDQAGLWLVEGYGVSPTGQVKHHSGSFVVGAQN